MGQGKRGKWGMTANGFKVSCRGDKNVLTLEWVAQYCEYTKNIIQLYSLNKWIYCYVNYTSIKLFKKIRERPSKANTAEISAKVRIGTVGLVSMKVLCNLDKHMFRGVMETEGKLGWTEREWEARKFFLRSEEVLLQRVAEKWGNVTEGYEIKGGFIFIRWEIKQHVCWWKWVNIKRETDSEREKMLLNQVFEYRMMKKHKWRGCHDCPSGGRRQRAEACISVDRRQCSGDERGVAIFSMRPEARWSN